MSRPGGDEFSHADGGARTETDEDFYTIELRRAGAIVRSLKQQIRERDEFIGIAIAAAGGELHIPLRLFVDPPKTVEMYDSPASNERVYRTRGAASSGEVTAQ